MSEVGRPKFEIAQELFKNLRGARVGCTMLFFQIDVTLVLKKVANYVHIFIPILYILHLKESIKKRLILCKVENEKRFFAQLSLIDNCQRVFTRSKLLRDRSSWRV